MTVSDNSVVFLEGKRLYLRPSCKEDVPYFLVWINDEEVRQYLNRQVPLTEAEEVEHLEESRKKKNNVFLVIIDKKSKRPIGCMGLHDIDWKDRRATTGAVIGDKRFWNRGYGTEAKMLLLNYAFNTLNLRKICSAVLSFNKRSQTYNRKCGYRVEGVLKKQVFINGAYCDFVMMGLFKEDWLPLWEKFKKKGRL